MILEWNRQQGLFYLHEDEWAMIDLLPSENFAELLGIAAQAHTFGEEHFDGIGWTAMYVIPEPTYPLAHRILPVHELQHLLGDHFLAARIVQSGYSSHRDTLPDAFAFVEAEKADGVLYGQQQGGLVTRLHLLPCNAAGSDSMSRLIEILHTVGTTYDLVLADWWNDTVIDLRERTRVVGYLEAAAHPEE